ncbi:MAG: hypothetical protein KDD35_12275, partial [Bdellovibrionales bacterium]|nr:hypothetical protein [Bdellovibrionales bacterium]
MESKSELEVIQPENSPRAEMIRSNLRCQYQLLDQFEYEPGVANSNGFFPPGPRQLFVSSKGSYFEVGTGIDSQFSRWVVRKNEQLDTKWRTVDDGSQFGDLSTEPRFIREIGNSLIVGGQKDIGWGATTVAAFRRSFDNGESWESLPDYLIHQSVYSPWSRTNVENCMAYDGDKLSCIVYTQHNLGLEFPEFPEAIKVSQTIKLINGEWIASPLRAHYREQDLEQGDRVVGPFRLADHNFYRLLIRKSKVIVLQKSADSIKWVNFSSNDFPIKDYVSVGAVKAIDGTLFFYLDITTIDPLTIGHVIQHDHYYYRFDSVKQILEVTPLGSQSFTNGNGKIAETPFSPRYIKKMDNKLVLIGSKGTAPMAAMISEDQGKTWYESTVFVDGSDDYSMDRKNVLYQDENTFVRS